MLLLLRILGHIVLLGGTWFNLSTFISSQQQQQQLQSEISTTTTSFPSTPRDGGGGGHVGIASQPESRKSVTDVNPTTTVATTKAEPTNIGSSDPSSSKTKIVGFADGKYKEIAITWYKRLSSLGYTNHVIIAVDVEAESYFQQLNQQNDNQQMKIRYEKLQYAPCLTHKSKDTRKYRRQLFGRRWKYIYDELLNGTHVLLTDVDNVFSAYMDMKQELELSEYDVYHAYSTSYPTNIFMDMGFTVCGGMGWYRATQSVRSFIGTLLNKCNCWKSVDCKCYCDDQVVLNELLYKGKHNVTWMYDDDSNRIFKRDPKPKDLNDLYWNSIVGVSSKTKHRIKIWERNVAYRGPMPTETSACPKNNWVSMPLQVDRDIVTTTWDAICNSNKH